MRRVVALAAALSLGGCSVIFNRVPERKVGPGDEFTCTTSYVPALIDVAIAAAFLTPAALPNDCGVDGCHSSTFAVEDLWALGSVPFILSALWGAYAANDCSQSYARARVAPGVQSADAPPPPPPFLAPGDDPGAVGLRR